MRWIDQLRRSRPRRIPGVCDALEPRATTTRAGRTPATRSRRRTAAGAAAAGPRASSRATSTTRSSAGRHLRGPRTAERCRAAPSPGRGPLYERFNDAFWWEAEGTYYLGLDGDKRPIRIGRLERRPPARSPASCRRTAPAASWPAPDGRRHVVRLGDPDAVVRPSGLQPVQLPHRDGLAARQRDDRRRLPALRLRRARRPGSRRACSTRPSGSWPPAAGAVRGPAAPEASFPVQYLGANVPQAWAAGSIFRFIAVLCGIHATTDRDRLAALRQPGAARLAPRADDPQPARRAGSARRCALTDGAVEVLSNTTGFEIIQATPERPQPRPLASSGRRRRRESQAASP